MSLIVSFRHMRPRDEVKARANALYSKLERFLDPASESQFTVEVEHGQAVVELVVTARGETHKVTMEHNDLRTAMDKLFHKMEEHLRRSKERRDTRRRSRPPEMDGFEPTEEEEEEAEAL